MERKSRIIIAAAVLSLASGCTSMSTSLVWDTLFYRPPIPVCKKIRLSYPERPADTQSGEIQWIHSKPAGVAFTRTEITLGQYKQCMDAGACNGFNPFDSNLPHYLRCNWICSNRDNHPMNCVSFEQATEFCSWAGGRLPTEEEWFAEASNGDKRSWPWGEGPKVSCDYAIWREGSDYDTRGCGREETWPVCSRPKGNSVSGLCDMTGNVQEWTLSGFDESRKVARGGSWFDDQENNLIPSARLWAGEEDTGFRCVRPLKPDERPTETAASGTSPPREGGELGLEWIYSGPAEIEFTKTEITLGQFKQCFAAGKCNEVIGKDKSDYDKCNWGHPDRDDHPMNCVNGYDAEAFCRWVGGRLPTKDEWNAEASNRSEKPEWPWGPNVSVSCERAIWAEDAKYKFTGCGRGTTWPVCSKPRGNSVSGLCDMIGNVWEWTSSDCFPNTSNHSRWLTGGSWQTAQDSMDAFSQKVFKPELWAPFTGFRCVRSPHVDADTDTDAAQMQAEAEPNGTGVEGR